MNEEELISYAEGSVNTSSTKQLADKATSIALRLLLTSAKFKKPRMEQIKMYEDLYANRVRKKLRVQFNVPVPVFSGMIDTLAADFDEPIQAKIVETNPADWNKVKKINALWQSEKTSTKLNAMWDYKARIDKKNALFCGRGIVKYYAESDPEYKSHLDVVGYDDFHCQPRGGGMIENHIFAGQENIMKTKAQLQMGALSGLYDKEQVKELLAKRANHDYEPEYENLGDEAAIHLNKFRAMGMDVQGNSYIGETVYNLCEFVITLKGKRWYVLFDPWTSIWIRFAKLTDVFTSDELPWVSWATHEDHKLFWSKSFADDIYPVADAVITMFNQELTNREKRNLGARAFDREMFQDVAKLDAAQYRPDALVPVDTKNGTRRISEGIYSFETPELQGTINLIQWINDTAGKEIGATDLSMGGVSKASKKASVVFAEQQQVSKRIGWRSQSYSEAWGRVLSHYVDGLKDHMPATMKIKMLGEDGWESEEISRTDLKTDHLEYKIISSTQQNQSNKLKKDARISALQMLAQSPNVNSKWRDEQILRDIGDYEDADIVIAMDTQNYGNKEMLSRASESIQLIIKGKTPGLYYGADTEFMQKIVDFATKNHSSLKDDKYNALMDYAMQHEQIVQKNMERKANEMISPRAQMGQESVPTQGVQQKPGSPGVTQALNMQ